MQRGQHKQMLIEDFAHKNSDVAEFLYDPDSVSVNQEYRLYRVNGHFLKQPQLLWENQFRDGQAGFDHLRVFRVEGMNKALLVDLGWVATELDLITDVVGHQSLKGYVYYPKKGFELGTVKLQKSQELQRIPYLNLAHIEPILQPPLYEFVLRLQQDLPGYRQDWPVVSMTPQKHWAYAIQWYGLALALLIIFWLYGCRYVRN